MRIIMFFLLMFCNFSFAQYQLRVEINGFKNDKGLAQIAIYQSEKHFLKKQYATATVKISNKKAIGIFENLPKSVYALAVFHDQNSNSKMDLSLFGIPKEAYGFSNNAKGFMSAPKFDDAKIELSQNLKIEMTVN